MKDSGLCGHSFLEKIMKGELNVLFKLLCCFENTSKDLQENNTNLVNNGRGTSKERKESDLVDVSCSMSSRSQHVNIGMNEKKNKWVVSVQVKDA